MTVQMGTQFKSGVFKCVVVGFYNLDTLEGVERVPMLPLGSALREQPSPLAYVGIEGFATGIPMLTAVIERLLESGSGL